MLSTYREWERESIVSLIAYNEHHKIIFQIYFSGRYLAPPGQKKLAAESFALLKTKNNGKMTL
jgi:hypothetical protein